MAKVKIQGHASGTGVLTVTAPNTSTDRTITLPDGTGTLIADDGSGNVGIGITPVEKLHLAADSKIQISGSGDSGNLISQNGSGTTQISLQGGAASQNFKFSVISNTSSYFTFNTNTGEQVRITDNGLHFNGDTAAANALDDYEEGTHTPTITMGSGTATFYSSNNTLAYTKIGRVVHISGQVRIENTNSASGSFQISMPFTVLSGNAGLSAGNYRTYNVDTPDAGVQAVIYSEGGQAKATLEWSRDSIGSTEERATANGYYLIGLTYFV